MTPAATNTHMDFIKVSESTGSGCHHKGMA